MIRGLIMILLFVAVGGLAGLYIAYGSVDPCRALAVEQSRRAADVREQTGRTLDADADQPDVVDRLFSRAAALLARSGRDRRALTRRRESIAEP